jgi:hypothetical protein
VRKTRGVCGSNGSRTTGRRGVHQPPCLQHSAVWILWSSIHIDQRVAQKLQKRWLLLSPPSRRHGGEQRTITPTLIDDAVPPSLQSVSPVSLTRGLWLRSSKTDGQRSAFCAMLRSAGTSLDRSAGTRQGQVAVSKLFGTKSAVGPSCGSRMLRLNGDGRSSGDGILCVHAGLMKEGW